MLTSLIIQNLAVLEQSELSFQSGMTVFTGETGAGKSILMDALGLALGERADTHLIRPNQSSAEVNAFFDIRTFSEIKHYLADRELSEQEECLIRRTLTEEGRSRAYINGHPVPVQYLKELSEKFITIHSQHQHHALLKTAYQMTVLDAYAEHPDLLEAISKIYQRIQAVQKEFQQLSRLQNQNEKLVLLEYQLNELNELNLLNNEISQLENEHKKLSQGDHWVLECEAVLNTLEEDSAHNLISMLHHNIQKLNTIHCTDARLKNSLELLNTALISLEEVHTELKDFKETLGIDPERLQFINDRLGHIFNLARKHRITPDLLFEHTEKLQQEANQLKNVEVQLKALEEKLQALNSEYQLSAKRLNESRNQSAKTLSQKIRDRLIQLDMPHARFEVQITETDQITETGSDHIEFLVSLNPGHPIQPLRKIASGGELSRISLAIQVITAEKMTIPTLIFDEVDVGVGGKTAEMIGQLLRELSKNTQVLCITHSPQVAAQGHHHYKVVKQQTKQSTKTLITSLSSEEKVQELARMMGGAQITENTLKHAQEMLEMVN